MTIQMISLSYDFIIYLHKSYVGELGFKLATPGSAVKHAADCAMVDDLVFYIPFNTINPCPAEPGYTLFCKECRSRSVGF